MQECEHRDEDTRRRHVVSLPVHRLPFELLACIFSICIPPQLSQHSSDDERSWLHITHVCRRWWEVARRAPHLWTNIALGRGSVQYVKESLVRSKSAPLHVYIYGAMEPQWTPDILEGVFSELPRVKDLVFTTVPPRLEAALTALPCLSRLRSLKVLPSPYYQEVHGAGGDLPRLLAALITDLKLPALRELRLLACASEWSTAVPFLPRFLTVLGISYDALYYATRNIQKPTFNEVAHSLSGLVLLRHLDLGSIPFLPSFPPISKAISLPHLETFSVSGPASDCIYLLQHFTFPTSVALSLFFRTMLNGTIIPLFLPFLASTVSSILALEGFGHAALESSMFSLQFYVDTEGAENSPGRILLDGEGYGLEVDYLYPHLPLHRITLLIMRDPFLDCLEAWMKLAAVARNVETLVLVDIPREHRRDFHALLRARQEPPHVPGESPRANSQELFFPHLQTLVFRNTDTDSEDETRISNKDGSDGDYECGNSVEDSNEDQPQFDNIIAHSGSSEERSAGHASSVGDNKENRKWPKLDATPTSVPSRSFCDSFVMTSLSETLRVRKDAGYKVERVIFEGCSGVYEPDIELLRGLVEMECNNFA
ncbi:hypothetical protein BXZ70DRAFT_1067273 [Cristinia sonorae]|uniref:F-box domain-containing protein n=1 Tax=Cristinia sonorae TaxID=1940300 RepID=A0A8K0UII5_9AGAR|nr:hypothetical protein BXZ70DRAFT_1067273 [Cristinia sonorae]